MNKPIIILREEFINKLAADIKESGLPAFIVRPIIDDILTQVREAERDEYRIASEAYSKAMQNAEAVEPSEPTNLAGE